MPLDLATAEDDILEAIDMIRPALQSDGGDIVYQGLDPDGVVHVSLVGACGTCPVSTMTLKAGVERIIMDRVPGVTEVVADEQRRPLVRRSGISRRMPADYRRARRAGARGRPGRHRQAAVARRAGRRRARARS